LKRKKKGMWASKCNSFMEKWVLDKVGCKAAQFNGRKLYPGQDVTITNASHNKLCSVRRRQPTP
jgi:hypothetical protein